MASGDSGSRDAVSKLSCKAAALVLKGHLASGVEKWRAALALALARTPPAQDCRIIAAIRVNILGALIMQCDVDGVPAAVKIKALDEGLNELLPAIVATLRQRHDARTLLGGCCRAAEEAWQRDQETAVLRFYGDKFPVRFSSSLIGYEVHLRAASCALTLGDITLFAQSEHLYAHWEFSVALAEEAIFFMSAPRCYNNSSLACEANLVFRLRGLGSIRSSGGGNVLPEPLRVRLVAAYRRLHDSGVLKLRRMAAALARPPDEDITTVAIQAAASAGLRPCALAACDAKEMHPAHFKSCAACKTVAYCCKEHQVQDWPAHKAACKAASTGGAERCTAAAMPRGEATPGDGETQ